MSVKVQSDELRAALRAVRHACSDDETRPILTTVLFSAVDGTLYLVTSDNFRIARFRLTTVEGDPSEFGELGTFITRDDAKALRKSLPKRSPAATVELERVERSGSPVLRVSARTATDYPIPSDWNRGGFPDYRKVATLSPADTAEPVVNPWYLMDAARAAAKSGALYARFALGPFDRPVRFESGELTEWIMGVRTDEHRRAPEPMPTPAVQP